MKFAVFAVLFVAVGASALPQQLAIDDNNDRESRIIVENQIRNIIQQISRAIRDAGLDPLEISRLDIDESIVPALVTVRGFVENLKFLGASNIAINNLQYSVLLNRLRFDMSLPNIELSMGNSEVTANVFGNRNTLQLRGTWSITQVRLSGEVRVNVGIISGISIRSLFVNFRVQNIQSDLTAIFQGVDYSDELNKLASTDILEFLATYQDYIDKYLTDIIREIADQVLGRNQLVY